MWRLTTILRGSGYGKRVILTSDGPHMPMVSFYHRIRAVCPACVSGVWSTGAHFAPVRSGVILDILSRGRSVLHWATSRPAFHPVVGHACASMPPAECGMKHPRR